MALFPIVGRYVGDFVPHLVAVDTDDTFDQIAEKVAVHSAGRRLPEPPKSARLSVVLDGVILEGGRTLGSLMGERQILPLQWFDVRATA
jgi:toluene monooxygenase system protein B